MAFSAVGLLIADYMEMEKPASELEKQELELMSPIIVIDHKKQ